MCQLTNKKFIFLSELLVARNPNYQQKYLQALCVSSQDFGKRMESYPTEQF